jgi:hypothetical protein
MPLLNIRMEHIRRQGGGGEELYSISLFQGVLNDLDRGPGFLAVV